MGDRLDEMYDVSGSSDPKYWKYLSILRYVHLLFPLQDNGLNYDL